MAIYKILNEGFFNKKKNKVIKGIYERLHDYLNTEIYTIGRGKEQDIIWLAQYAKIPESVFIDRIKKSNNKDIMVSLLDFWGDVESYEDVHKGKEKQFGIKDIKDPCLKLIYDDTSKWLVYTPNGKLLDVYNMKQVQSFYNFFWDKEELIKTYDKKAIEEIDKELGYYIFSECPKEIKQKKFI